MTTPRDFGGVLGDGLWTLSFGLSEFHGHGPWLVCEVAVNTVISVSSFLSSAHHNITPSTLQVVVGHNYVTFPWEEHP